MKQNQEIKANQIQKLILTPDLRQSLSILQMPLAELETYITRQLLENCLLEQEEEKSVEEDFSETLSINYLEEKAAEKDGADEDVYLVDENLSGEPRAVSNDQTLKTYENLRTPAPSLHEHLISQLHLFNLTEPENKIAEFLIENIDGDGYLKYEVKEAARLFRTTWEVVENLLHLIQSFEPSGVGQT